VVFDSQTLNKIISIVLIVALIVMGLVQIVGLITEHPVTWIEGAIIALLALLSAYRHGTDVKNENGSSGLTPKG
jgi:hypothetical protein